MKFILAFMVLASATVPAFAREEALSIERLFASPELAGQVPRGLKFSNDGKRLMFLSPKLDDYEVLDLWEYDLKTGAPHLLVDSKKLASGELSEEEKARRERQRVTHSGITEFVLSKDGGQILIPSGGELYLVKNGDVRKLKGKKGAALDLKFSPKDRFVSYVRDQNLYIREPGAAGEIAVTTDGRGAVSYGVAEYVAQEEMDRFTGYWWSEDESYLALTRVDESRVKTVTRYEIDADTVKLRTERYPEAGSANAKVQLGIVKVADLRKGNRKIQWLPLAETDDIYLARADWTPDRKLVYQVQSRDQKTLALYEFDPKTGRRREILRETDPRWVELHDDLRFLEKSPGFIWASERTGYKHLYLYGRDGKLLRPLTQGEWVVDQLDGVDEAGGWAYFTATLKSPLEKQLYRVSLKEPREPELLTREEGWHAVTMNRTATMFLDTYSSTFVPPRVFLSQADGTRVKELSKNEVVGGHPLFPYMKSLVAPEYGSFTGPSGEPIYYRVLKPRDFKPDRKYPLVVRGYGGPTRQVVIKKWKDLWDQVLVARGFVVASFDNRGSSRRGRKFSDALHHAVGTVEVEDQVAGVKHLIEKGYIDEKRVGFHGWSYGGYLSLMLAAKAADVFHANLSVAPVTDFASYDTHYTERYLGKPKDEAAVYKRANVRESAAGIKGRLMVIHGMADDNVLFTNSTLLFKTLQDNGTVFESVTYPGAKHGISGKLNQTHVLKTIVDFFERTFQ